MSVLGELKRWVNGGLSPFNVRLETLTAERAEAARLRALQAQGNFGHPVFPILRQFEDCDPAPILAEVALHEQQFARFASPDSSGYRFDNDYYQSPDAEVLYAIVRLLKPKRIVEVGSGNSTLLFRHAIGDGALDTQLTSIDPSPRLEIARHADVVLRTRLEEIVDEVVFGGLRTNDLLFIDSSHEIKPGNDVLKLFLTIMPSLAAGVVVHVHDVFLPYDYPAEWVVINRWNWTEQYLLQALLQESDTYEVLWCGHYLQRTRPELPKRFRFWTGPTHGRSGCASARTDRPRRKRTACAL
jgi:predicted O-methyltransferase YrrM